MKKFAFIAMAALAMTFVACGNQNGANNSAEKKEKATKEVTYKIYTNEKYGFTVEIPETMTQRGEAMGEEGTVFSWEDESSAVTFNRIDISGSEQIFGEDYTIEGVKESLAEWRDFSEFSSQETGDNYFTSTTLGQYVNEIDHIVVNGPIMVSIAVCYDPEHEKELGGEVAEHVFKSVKFTR